MQGRFQYPLIALYVYFSDKPSAPKNLNVRDISKNSMTLRWSAPEDDGGSKILGYTIEKREGTRRMWQNVGTTEDSEIEVCNLIEGNQYAFRVIAENKVGSSEPSELRDQVTAKSQYSKSQFRQVGPKQQPLSPIN